MTYPPPPASAFPSFEGSLLTRGLQGSGAAARKSARPDRSPANEAATENAAIAPPQRGRVSAASALATRQMLLHRVREVFSQRGYLRTTVQDIIEGTGLSRGAFHRHFDSTDHAFITMIDLVVDDLVEASRSRGGRTQRERVHGGNLRYLEVFARHRGAMRALAEGALLNPEIQAVQGRVRAAWMHRVRDHLVRQCALGRCRPLDPDAATMSLGMMVEGAAMCLLGAGFEPFEQPLELERLCRQITDIWCEAVYLEPDRDWSPDGTRSDGA